MLNKDEHNNRTQLNLQNKNTVNLYGKYRTAIRLQRILYDPGYLLL